MEQMDKAQCAECGTDVPPDAPLGLCPACLLKRAMQATTAGGGGRGSAGGWSGGFDPPAVADLVPLFPHLEILEFVGRGGMGAVYKARQPHLDRFVAVKILPTTIADDPAFAERFAREARSLARLNHANIVTVHDFGRAGPYFFFVMEFVDGANLRQAILAKTLEPRQALAIVPQICDALQYAHDEGIVHRDIKPENVLLDKRGRVKIADFGLAKLLQKTPQNITLTQTHVTMGTPHYMAPEQTERPLEVDHRADIYSLGVVFYEMLTGELPLGRFAPPSQKAAVDARLDDVVFKTLEKEPGRRYQQASEVKTGVQDASSLPPPLPPRAGASEPFLPYARRHPQTQTQMQMQYSRVAWAGAIWGALGILSLLVPLTFGAVASTVVFITLPFLLITITAVIGMPACGFIAISQIHRSNGQMTGLRLAVFDALAFPLLLVNVLLLLVAAAVPSMALPLSYAETLAIVAVIGLPLCGVLDFLVARWVWRQVSARLPQDAPAVAPTGPGNALHPSRSADRSPAVLSYGEGPRYSRTAIVGAAWAATGLMLPVLGLFVGSYFWTGQAAPRVAVPAAPTRPGLPAAPVAPVRTTTRPAELIRSSPGGGNGSSGGGPIGSTRPGALQQADTPVELERASRDVQVRAAQVAERARVQRQQMAVARGIPGSGGGGGSGGTLVPGAPTPPTTVTLAPVGVSRSFLTLILSPIFLLALTAPFGATILGLVAISQIRQSSGRLYGMPLAIFDTLLFPLLLLDALIVGGITLILTRGGSASGAAMVVSMLVALAAAVVADVWIVRRVRDAANTVPAAGTAA